MTTLYTLRQVARKTRDNPAGLGLIDLHHKNLMTKILMGQLLPVQERRTPGGYQKRLFDQKSISDYLNQYGNHSTRV